MSLRGRPRAATPAQVEQFRLLAAEAVSERKIAEIVFGDARYRGRVERLVHGSNSSSARPLPGEHAPEDKGIRADEHELPSIRELLDRHRQRLAEAGELPSLKELQLLLKLEQQVETQEALERLNALTRAVS